jgi:hypothetical protein
MEQNKVIYKQCCVIGAGISGLAVLKKIIIQFKNKII